METWTRGKGTRHRGHLKIYGNVRYTNPTMLSKQYYDGPLTLTNTPATFQHFMNDIFSDLLDVHVVVYLDDILIYSNDITQHWSHIKEVLKWLRKSGLYTKAEKCEFHLDSVEYLGYVLSPSGLTMSNAKVKTIQEWPEPKKIKDIQFFLEFTNFYRCFIFNYSDIVILLTCLTRKNTLWNFDNKCRMAFNTLKQAFTSTPIFMLLCYKWIFHRR